MTRVAIVDPQPAVRAGLVDAAARRAGPGARRRRRGRLDGAELIARERPDVVLLEHQLLDGDGIALCRRIKAERRRDRVSSLYTALPDAELELLARVAGADGLVDKARAAGGAVRGDPPVARGDTALPPLTRAQLDAAAHRVDPDDLALLAMLVDRTSPADVAATLRLDRRRVAKRIERVLGRLRRAAPTQRRRLTRARLLFLSPCPWSPWSSSAPRAASASSTSTRACSTSASSSSARRSTTRSRTWSSRSCCTSSPQDPDKDISIYINSPGGSIYAGLAVYDTMQFIKPDVATICVGIAMSMGSLLLTGGANGKRMALPNSRSSSTSRRPASRASRRTSRSTRARSSRRASASTRSTRSTPGSPRSGCTPTWSATASSRPSEAVEYGLIDRVLEHH